MNKFFEKVGESIAKVDAQMDFDSVLKDFDRAKASVVHLGSAYKKADDFLLNAEPSSDQVNEILRHVISVGLSEDSSEYRHETLQLLLSICQHSIGPCRDLLDLTDNGATVFSFLDSTDMIVRYDVLQLMHALYRSHSSAMMRILLASPDVLGKVIDMVRPESDSDFLRNESVSFLLDLSRDPVADILPILVFQGVADSLVDLLLQDESSVVAADLLDQAMSLLRNLCSHPQSSRYIRDAGGCDWIHQLLDHALRPVIDHAYGFASQEDEDESPESLQIRIDSGWTQAAQVLVIADLIMTDMESADMKNVFLTNGSVGLMKTCGESLYLNPKARALCYDFISHVLLGNEASVASFVLLGEELPVLWSIFQSLVDERTPLIVRAAIDNLVAAVCVTSPQAQSEMIAQLVPMAEEDLADQSPGRIATAVLLHAAMNLSEPVPDDSPLASQAWYSLMTIGHIFRGNPDMQRSAATLRVAEGMTLLDLLVTTAKRRLSVTPSVRNTVSTGALMVLTEWMLNSPSQVIGSVFTHTGIELDFSKSLIDTFACSGGVPGSAHGVAIFIAALLLYSPETAEALLDSIKMSVGLVGFDALLLQAMTAEKEKRIGVPRRIKFHYTAALEELPTVRTEWFAQLVGTVVPAVRKVLLREHLRPDTILSSPATIDPLHVQEELDSLRAQVELGRSRYVDLQVALCCGPELLVEENERVRALNEQLRRECRSNESEIMRMKVVHAAERKVWEERKLELEQQVEALNLSYVQLGELAPPALMQQDHRDLVELVEVLRSRFPEINEFIKTLGSARPNENVGEI